MKPSILIVEDEKLLLTSLYKALSREGYRVISSTTGEEALDSFRESSADIVLLDVRLPGLDGMQVLKTIKTMDNNVPIIIMTAFSGIKGAVEAMKLGAHDYIAKPFDIEELKFVLAKCLVSQKAVTEVNKIRSTRRELYTFENIITSNAKIKTLISQSKRLAQNAQSTVLIMGESGTGKELFANAIHYNGPRSDDPLITVNCAALTEGILESELFGHEKGAFTGAVKRKKGMFELADRGTLFLDEIAEISNKTQVKLLRFLEEKKIQRVGGIEHIEVDVRIVAATNKDLLQQMKMGKFREDLYYRLNVISFVIPPLRERKNDIPLLIDYFVGTYNKVLNKNVRGCDGEALEILKRYPWPGNIRELRNIIERAMLLSDGNMIKSSDIPIENTSADGNSNMAKINNLDPMPLDRLISSYVQSILKQFENNRSRTAEALRITRQRLRRILKSLVD
ncbi:MAG: sigma-54 dependent transcriptional regulator [Syntrophales bacterium]